MDAFLACHAHLYAARNWSSRGKEGIIEPFGAEFSGDARCRLALESFHFQTALPVATFLQDWRSACLA